MPRDAPELAPRLPLAVSVPGSGTPKFHVRGLRGDPELARRIEAGRRTALVHTSMRDLLPPGGLSLCPVDAEAGAHGVLLGEPLSSLIAARVVARDLRRRIRAHFGGSMALNAGLMVVSALAAGPPISVAIARHGFSALLLAQSARLARHSEISASHPSRE